MNISLTRELEEMVQTKVASGRYTSANEVVREALSLMSERDAVVNLHRDALRQKIATGVASLRRGDGQDGEAVFDRLESE